MEIRNIAIIAHVDHGKTTLTDAILRQTGAAGEGVSMDSNTLEQERGITIYSKNTSVPYKGTKINIVDTPGHADFGSEVERVLRSIDSVLLVVDAQEGPMPQTRFVLKKSLELGLKPIVVINKIDKPAADPDRCEELVLELFFELGANEAQADFPVVYAIGRQGIAKKKLEDESSDLTPLLDTILEKVPAASSAEKSAMPLRVQPFNLAYDNFLGRLAIARIHEGTIKTGQNVFIKKPDGSIRTGRVTKLFTFKGFDRVDTESAEAGDIALIAGLTDIDIGETICEKEDAEALPAIKVDEPTIALNFLVNNSPFAGRDGKYVTSRQLRDYLERELQVNVGLRVDFESSLNASRSEASGGQAVRPGLAEFFRVYGRGEMHISILLENMRRAGYEVQVSQPQVVTKMIEGKLFEPFEEVIIDVPSEFQGTVIERMGLRSFIVKDIRIEGDGAIARLFFEGPTRGLLGYRNQFVIDTKGEGILSSRFLEFRPHVGEIKKRLVGSMISMATGKTETYALWKLQDRGVLYVGQAVEVYEGMIIGNTSKGEEMPANPTKAKAATNVRTAGSEDVAMILTPPFEITIERGLELMGDDEYLEVTPKNVRLRKQGLTETARSQMKRSS